jgi:hypothetical protein
MSTDSDTSSVSRRQFLAVASGAAAAGSISVGKVLASPPPTPPFSYTVTIDASTTPISYTVVDSSGAVHNAYRLRVKSNDKVSWKMKSGGAQHGTVLFIRDTPLVDANNNNNPLFAVDTSNAVVGLVDQGASGIYEYYVAVFDPTTNKTYTDDPKIIVGSGNIVVAAELEPILNTVLGEVKELKPSSSDQRRRVESIEDNLEKLIKQLN